METASNAAHTLSHDLRSAVADLDTVNPWVGLGRFVSIGFPVFCFVWLAWSTSNSLLFVSYTLITGVFYAFWLVCTHDTVHYTLTSWKWFDRWMPRLISYVMFWPYGTYAQLHRLHHAWNGIDLRDPERVQWTQEEYQHANSLQQWYVRHQWYVDIFALGGLGLITKTIRHALRLRHQFPILSHALLQDALGMLIMQTVIGTVVIWNDRLLRYIVFWFLLERVVGVLLQARDHLEHYGVWHPATGHQLTQLYSCRNLKTPVWVSWLMGGLNDHAVHHAFPHLPFNHLAEAFDRIQAVLVQHHLPPLERNDGYIHETLRLSQRSLLIESG